MWEYPCEPAYRSNYFERKIARERKIGLTSEHDNDPRDIILVDKFSVVLNIKQCSQRRALADCNHLVLPGQPFNWLTGYTINGDTIDCPL